MKLEKILFDSKLPFSEKELPIPILGNGEFSVLRDGAVLCGRTGVKYPIPRNSTLLTVALKDVQNLTDTEALPVIYLWALSRKPLNLPKEILQSPKASGLSIFFRNAAHRRVEESCGHSFTWLVPIGGIPLAPASAYRYILGFTGYAIDITGKVIRVHDDSEVLSVADSNSVKINSDTGNYLDMNKGELVALAFGLVQPETLALELRYLDDNPGNPALSNLSFAYREEPTKLIAITPDKDLVVNTTN